jgi:hypothetical protein
MYPARASRSHVYQEETSKALKLEARSVEGRKKNMEAWRITLSRNCRQNIICYP